MMHYRLWIAHYGLKLKVIGYRWQQRAKHRQADSLGHLRIVFIRAEVHAKGVASVVKVVDRKHPVALPAAARLLLAINCADTSRR